MVRIQRTYQNQVATLFLVATPIGNCQEMSAYAITILKKVAVIFCEDTRISRQLFQRLGIQKKLFSFHKFNEKQKIVDVLKQLQLGYNVALVSCAGIPLIADPGYKLVLATVQADFNVTAVGINSPLLSALICSAIDCNKFIFHNFLLPSRFHKNKQIIQLLQSQETVVCYESVHKLKTTLAIMQKLIPHRKFCLGREISKVFETFYRGCFQDLDVKNITFKGEFVLVIAADAAEQNKSFLNLQVFVDKMKELKLTNKQIVSIGKQLYSFSKKELYQLLVSQGLSNE